MESISLIEAGMVAVERILKAFSSLLALSIRVEFLAIAAGVARDPTKNRASSYHLADIRDSLR